MIISDRHKYLFVELPHTASTAISHELCEHYDGRPVLWKHAHRFEFLKMASAEQKKYAVIAGMRNPVDVVVTQYFKKKTNHQGFFTNPQHWRRNGGHVSDKDLEQFRFIQKDNADFATFFMKFYQLPYDSYGYPDPDDFDEVIRYEKLQEDFSGVLRRLGIEQVRPLPLVNKTSGKEADFWSYFPTHVQKRSTHVFGPYFMMWSYDFPSSWGKWHLSPLAANEFRLLGAAKKLRIRLLALKQNHPQKSIER